MADDRRRRAEDRRQTTEDRKKSEVSLRPVGPTASPSRRLSRVGDRREDRGQGSHRIGLGNLDYNFV